MSDNRWKYSPVEQQTLASAREDCFINNKILGFLLRRTVKSYCGGPQRGKGVKIFEDSAECAKTFYVLLVFEEKSSKFANISTNGRKPKTQPSLPQWPGSAARALVAAGGIAFVCRHPTELVAGGEGIVWVCRREGDIFSSNRSYSWRGSGPVFKITFHPGGRG